MKAKKMRKTPPNVPKLGNSSVQDAIVYIMLCYDIYAMMHDAIIVYICMTYGMPQSLRALRYPARW